MTQQQKQFRHFYMSDDEYFTLKELASLRGKAHVGTLAKEIFADYIRQHQDELLNVR